MGRKVEVPTTRRYFCPNQIKKYMQLDTIADKRVTPMLFYMKHRCDKKKKQYVWFVRKSNISVLGELKPSPTARDRICSLPALIRQCVNVLVYYISPLYQVAYCQLQSLIQKLNIPDQYFFVSTFSISYIQPCRLIYNIL